MYTLTQQTKGYVTQYVLDIKDLVMKTMKNFYLSLVAIKNMKG